MKWRKWNRWIHRELGYLFFGMAIVYGVSGIALNHHIARHWNPSLVERSEQVPDVTPVPRQEVTKEYVMQILEVTGEMDNYKQYYFPNDLSLMIYLDKVSMVILAITGLFMVRGKKGIRGQGAVLLAIGIIVPLAFLLIYLWT